MKTLETTDLKKWPGLDALQVRELIQCDYLTPSENLAFLGRHGTGKNHATTILGVEACRQGYRVLFSTAAGLKYAQASIDQWVTSFFRPNLQITFQLNGPPAAPPHSRKETAVSGMARASLTAMADPVAPAGSPGTKRIDFDFDFDFEPEKKETQTRSEPKPVSSDLGERNPNPNRNRNRNRE